MATDGCWGLIHSYLANWQRGIAKSYDAGRRRGLAMTKVWGKLDSPFIGTRSHRSQILSGPAGRAAYSAQFERCQFSYESVTNSCVLPRKVGARRTATLCFLTPPSEPDVRLSPHPALWGLTTFAPRITPGLVISFAFTAAPAILRDHRLTQTSSGTKQLLDQENVNPLASFPLCAAFPRSEYYDASDACTLHSWTAQLPAQASHVHDDGLCKIV
jgi:hypothetical protein